MQHTTRASEAPCPHCRVPLLYAWDEGLLVRAEAQPIGVDVACYLRAAGHAVYARTDSGWLIHETERRFGSLRLVRSRHVEHDCPRKPAPRPVSAQLELDLGSVRPPTQQGGLW